MQSIEDAIVEELQGIRHANRWRATEPASSGLCFSSNDYLGLSRHPEVILAAQAALARHGAGATGSRLMAGQLAPHAALESALAQYFGTEAALVFPSGYQGNIGLLTALANRDTHIFSDALNHASLIDGARLSRATIQVYPHNDVAALEIMLAGAPPGVRKLVVTESVFSMDGDCAPVRALASVSERHGAALLVDEAHAIGVFGGGRGLCAREGVAPFALLGTLSKALGSQGGFVAGPAGLRDLLVNRARTFIFTTGLAPACAAAGLAALHLIEADPGMGVELLRRTAVFRAALQERGVHTPGEAQIVPVVLGDEQHALAAAAACRQSGVEAHAIRPPTVPSGRCRLRLSITLEHSEADLAEAAAIIAASLSGMEVSR